MRLFAKVNEGDMRTKAVIGYNFTRYGGITISLPKKNYIISRLTRAFGYRNPGVPRIRLQLLLSCNTDPGTQSQ